MTILHSGDILRIDFGLPVGSEAGLIHFAVVLTANEVLSRSPNTIQVVPVTSNTRRRRPGDVTVDALPVQSVAESDLITTVSLAARADALIHGNVGPVAVAQIRSVVADLLDLPA